VLISSARPEGGNVPNTARYSSSKSVSSYAPTRSVGQYRRGQSQCANTLNTGDPQTRSSRPVRSLGERADVWGGS
jgi:hypothetical protein